MLDYDCTADLQVEVVLFSHSMNDHYVSTFQAHNRPAFNQEYFLYLLALCKLAIHFLCNLVETGKVLKALMSTFSVPSFFLCKRDSMDESRIDSARNLVIAIKVVRAETYELFRVRDKNEISEISVGLARIRSKIENELLLFS